MSEKIYECRMNPRVLNCYSLRYVANRWIEQCIHVATTLLDCRYVNNVRLKFTSYKHCSMPSYRLSNKLQYLKIIRVWLETLSLESWLSLESLNIGLVAAGR